MYAELAALVRSPIVELNRAVAVGMAEGPEAGLAIVDRLMGEPALKGYHLLPSVRGDLLHKLGRYQEAHAAFEADPTVSLDVKRYAPIRAAILAQPDGEALLAKTHDAQREGVARGIDNVYTGSFIAGLVILVICLTLREIPLRRSFEDLPRERLATEVAH